MTDRQDLPLQHEVTLLELVDRVLNKGVVLTGDITLSVAGVDLVYVGLRVLLASAGTLDRLAISNGNGGGSWSTCMPWSTSLPACPTLPESTAPRWSAAAPEISTSSSANTRRKWSRPRTRSSRTRASSRSSCRCPALCCLLASASASKTERASSAPS